MDTVDIEPEYLYRVSGDMFERMVDAGVFAETDDHVELLEGVLVCMSPQGVLHARTVIRLNKLLVRLIGDRADVAPQVTFRAAQNSFPEPDLAIWPLIEGRRKWMNEALLVVEISVSTLRFDRRVKTRIYADASVPEYWIVNLKDDVIERHTVPAKHAYERVETFHRGERITLAAFPDLAVAVDDVLPSPASP